MCALWALWACSTLEKKSAWLCLQIPLSLIHFQADWNECINRLPSPIPSQWENETEKETRKKKKCEIMNELRIAWSYHVSLPCTEHTRQNIVSKFEMGMFRCTNRELDSLKSRTATHSHKYTREKRPKVSTTGRKKKKQSMAKRNEMNWFYHQIPYYENNPKSPAPIISNHSSFTWRTQNWWKRKRECGHTVFSDQHSSFISSLVDAK